ncbi:MAG: transposase [Colwellia sp.]|nr:transposase [Colwellia sp.]
MSWNDLRKGRFNTEHAVYFITFVVENRQPLFHTFNIAQIFCQLITENEQHNDCQWLTWVLMPDHFHGLLQLSHKANLADIIRTLKSKSALLINRSLKKRGSIWQKAYFERSIRKEEELIGIARYIVANPLRAKIIDRVENYPFWNSVYL